MFRCTSWYLIHTHTAIIWSNVSDTFLSAGREETDMCALEVNLKILPIVSSIMSWLVCHAHLMFQHAFTVRDWLPITRFHEWQRATDNAKWYSVETIWNFFIVVSEWCGWREGAVDLINVGIFRISSDRRSELAPVQRDSIVKILMTISKLNRVLVLFLLIVIQKLMNFNIIFHQSLICSPN